ncbi:hypothetical protein EG327_007104 [Venturia inaequalis]|uniref:Uncharacterized protein n=1 Tax=Venturia inaequalis TaxID=5025 RepID=A0A8H3VPG7_VENIN|nr:hypothetical protein EG327_007104 [Venturia inaequalis]
MSSSPDYLMSPPNLESITVLGNAENWSAHSTSNLSPERNFEKRLDYALEATHSPFEETYRQQHEPFGYQEGNYTMNDRQSPGPPNDKQPNEMTFRELNYLVNHLSNKSERSQQAAAEIKQRPEYLEHAKSSAFAADKQLDMERPVSTPPRSALQPSTTPIGSPPPNIDHLSHNLLSLSSQHPLAPVSSTAGNGSSTNSSNYLIPSCTRDLVHAEELVQQALSHLIAHRSASLPSWQAPTNDPWEIPSPVGAPIQAAYVVPPACDMKVVGDHTGFVPDQAWLAVDNLPPAMGFIEHSMPRRRKGGSQKSFTNELPVSISREVEGWRLSYWFRRFPDVELKDIAERIVLPLGQSARTKEELKLLCNTLSMRHQRWCAREGGLMLSRTNKHIVSSKQLEIIERSLLLNGFQGLERNTIWALDQPAGQMIQPMVKGTSNFQGSRCIAPQRARLEPRVDASLKMYIGVVKESRSRGLANWRQLKKENWPGLNDADRETDEQDDDQSMQGNPDDDVQMPHAQTPPSVRAQTVPPNYGASFNHAFLAQQLPSVTFSMSPPVQQQRPTLQQLQQPQFSQDQIVAAYQHVNDYHGQFLGPISHGLPLHMNDMQPAMRGPNVAAIATSCNITAHTIEWYDAQQLQEKNGFIDALNQVFNQLVDQGVSLAEAYATSQQARMQYTDAQRRNRKIFVQAQHVGQNATNFRHNGAQPEGRDSSDVIDLISPAPTRFTPVTPHTPPTPSKAPNPKRMRFSESPSPTEQAARNIEIDEEYDEDQG